ncbi:hypothetical protein [Nocardia sp.]|uniref:hypothetical protein n=1 Tax=Nocardia sp. TaxID=1821 RepID=UPI00258CA78D|nr:hypothetical protein [Nocardia sp.]
MVGNSASGDLAEPEGGWGRMDSSRLESQRGQNRCSELTQPSCESDEWGPHRSRHPRDGRDRPSDADQPVGDASAVRVWLTQFVLYGVGVGGGSLHSGGTTQRGREFGGELEGLAGGECAVLAAVDRLVSGDIVDVALL